MSPDPAGTPPSSRVPAESDELAWRQARQRRRLRWILAVTVLLAAGALARPGWRVAKRWQSERLAGQAQAALRADRPAEAVRLAQAALQLSFNPAAVAANAEALGAIERPADALPFWLELERQRPLREAELLELIGCLLATGQFPVAQERLGSLPDDVRRQQPQVLLWQARLEASQGRSVQAAALADRLLQSSPTTAAQRLQAVGIVALHGSGRARADALAAVRELAAGQDATSLQALLFLAQQRLPLREGDAVSTAAALERHPLTSLRAFLAACDIRLREEPQNEAAIRQSILERIAAGDDEFLAIHVEWLIRRGEFAEAVRQLPPSRPMRTPVLSLLQIEALLGDRQWEEALRLLAQDRLPIPEFVRDLRRAELLERLHRTTDAQGRWQRLRQESEGQLDRIAMLARAATRAGNRNVAEQAWRDAITLQPEQRELQFEFLRFLTEQADSQGALRQLQRMRRIWPDDAGLAASEAYLAALRREAVGESVAQLRVRLAREPERLELRCALGLRLWRDGSCADALLEVRPLILPTAPASLRVVAAVALLDCGFKDEAVELAESIAQSKLWPEERDLLTRLRPRERR